jgi:hypothetical protein
MLVGVLPPAGMKTAAITISTTATAMPVRHQRFGSRMKPPIAE